MGWGRWPALSLNNHSICVCEEARNTGFLDLGFNFVFIAPDEIVIQWFLNYVILIK